MIRFRHIIVLALLCTSCRDVLVTWTDDASPISFSASSLQTRSSSNESAILLGDHFTVYGNKSNGTEVFTGYRVDYGVDGWNYVNAALNQDLKYFDPNVPWYTFMAYSTGAGAASVSSESLDGFTVTGNQAALNSVYFTDQIKVESQDYNNNVRLTFNRLASMIRVGFYEEMDGYSVKDMVFYTTDHLGGTTALASGQTAIYASGDAIPLSGSYTVSFGSDGKAVCACTPASSTDNLSLGSFTSQTISGSKESCTFTEWCMVLPTTIAQDMYVKADYKIVNDSDPDDIIQVNGMVATIKAVSGSGWAYNKRYSYAFQVSSTGLSDALIMTDEWDQDYRH